MPQILAVHYSQMSVNVFQITETRLFVQELVQVNNKGNIKDPHYRVFVMGGFSAQRTSNMERVHDVIMSRCYPRPFLIQLRKHEPRNIYSRNSCGISWLWNLFWKMISLVYVYHIIVGFCFVSGNVLTHINLIVWERSQTIREGATYVIYSHLSWHETHLAWDSWREMRPGTPLVNMF